VQVGNLEACATNLTNVACHNGLSQENFHKAIMTKPKPAIADGNLSLGQKAQIVAYAANLRKVHHRFI
jgi:hypothetical protein